MGGVDCGKEGEIPQLVARTGRLMQRYSDGYRLVAGCIPFRYRSCSSHDGTSSEQTLEVLMISSTGGRGLLFPKGGWESDETVEQAAAREALEEAGVRGVLMGSLGEYDFKSKAHRNEACPQGLCKAEMFALHVKEELESWPEQTTRRRIWLTIPQALERCMRPWMQLALDGFTKWHAAHQSPSESEGKGKEESRLS